MSEPTEEVFDGRDSRLTRREADAIWEQVQARYAAGASGVVTLYARDVYVHSVFLERDLPALRANPAVTALTLVDPETHEQIVLRRGEF